MHYDHCQSTQLVDVLPQGTVQTSWRHLDKHDVPDLQHVRVVLINQRSSVPTANAVVVQLCKTHVRSIYWLAGAVCLKLWTALPQLLRTTRAQQKQQRMQVLSTASLVVGCAPEQGPQGPWSPISQKLSLQPKGSTRSVGSTSSLRLQSRGYCHHCMTLWRCWSHGLTNHAGAHKADVQHDTL